MKILYLITKSEIGGAQTHVFQLVNFFIKNNYEVAVMSFPGGWLEKVVSEAGAQFHPNVYFGNSFNPMRFFNAISEIRTLIKSLKPDLVACHSTSAGFIGRLAVGNSVPTIYTAHGWSFEPGTPIWRRLPAILLEKYAAKFCRKIICVSKYTRDIALKYRIADRDKFIVVYNGVENIFNEKSLVSKIIRIIFIGRLSKQKNPELLIEATNRLSADILNKIEIKLVGDGPKALKLNNVISNCNNLRVEIIKDASREDALNILKNSDIFVLSSNWEGLPYAILEAMSMGVPIIASNVGGISEAVTADCGFLIEKGDVEGLINSLEKLINNEKLRQQMGAAAQTRARSIFSLEKMCIETEKVYQDVLKNN